MTPTECIIGTRGSKLAMTQTRAMAALLGRAHPSVRFTIQTITTRGDVVLDKALPAIGGKGLFTTEIERALLAGDVHLAVHSLKDLPTELPDGLCVAAAPKREDPRDVLATRDGAALADLPRGTVVGTSSLRRQAQLLAHRPDLTVRDLRGNVDTRLRKLQEGQVDAAILAAAGLVRLGLLDDSMAPLPTDVMLPAVGQGALAIEAATDTPFAGLAASIADADTTDCVKAERALLEALGGGCHVPIAGHATVAADGRLCLVGLVSSTDGSRVARDTVVGPRQSPEAIGAQLAERLLRMGAKAILDGHGNAAG